MKRDVELLLLKLTDGGRILRLSEPRSGLCLEKRLDPQDSLLRQKQRWLHVFTAMIDRELDPAS